MDSDRMIREDGKFTIAEFTRLLETIQDVLGLQTMLARIEHKIDEHIAGHFTPEQQAVIDGMKAKLDANDAAVAAALKK